MTKFLIFDRQRFTAFLFYLFCIFLTLLISGCGDGSYDSDSSETASAFFTIEWHDTPTIQSSENTRIAKALDCEDVGVEEITCDVYDGSSTYLTSGGPWECSAGSGTIDNIPVGQGIEFVVLGFNGENIWYYGKTTGITITGLFIPVVGNRFATLKIFVVTMTSWSGTWKKNNRTYKIYALSWRFQPTSFN